MLFSIVRCAPVLVASAAASPRETVGDGGSLVDANTCLLQSHFTVDQRDSSGHPRDDDGFFPEDSDEDWRLRKQRHVAQARLNEESWTTCRAEWVHEQKICMPSCSEFDTAKCTPNVFWQVHYEPTFSCLDSGRIGNVGEGGKWVCDPYKLTQQVKEGRGCLVYSVGSNGDYSFEKSVHDTISDGCEIHTIDMNPWSAYTTIAPPAYVKYHEYTVGLPPSTPVSSIVRDMGHSNKTIDLFKIDCEGCEWSSFRSWFGEGVHIRQIQVELHGEGTKGVDGVHDFFQFLFDQGYVVFNKEPNTLGCRGDCIEYSFLKLEPSFTRASEPDAKHVE